MCELYGWIVWLLCIAVVGFGVYTPFLLYVVHDLDDRVGEGKTISPHTNSLDFFSRRYVQEYLSSLTHRSDTASHVALPARSSQTPTQTQS